ncbi:MAG: acyl-protein synthetase [Bacteroidales bacterium]|nr:acyl-protein synthetase [Bacteroidales bacterium]
MKYLDELFELKDALNHTKEADDLFLAAVKEAFAFHYQHNKVYKNLCDDEGFNIESVKTVEDVVYIPHFLVDAFKWYDFLSVDKSEIVSTFTSSGTSGQKSHISWDKGSKDRQTQMREKIMDSYGLETDQKVNYLIFAYSPRVSEGKGAAYAHQMYSTFAPENKKVFAIDADENGKAYFNEKLCVDMFTDFQNDNIPLRIIGFPAFIYDTLLYMKANDIRLKFSADSLVIIAGGWKSAENKSIPFDEFAELIDRHLGIHESRIRDVYGFVEHGVPYITCEYHHFHVPVYSKAFVRKPGTMEVLSEGEKGLLQVISPYNYAQPALSILSTDYAIIHSRCACGRTGQYIELMGRAGLKKHEGCAITATELLKATHQNAVAE